MDSTVRISREVLDAIGEEDVRSPGREICGLLLGLGDRITGHRTCFNVSDTPASAFEIAPWQLIAAHRAARAGGPQIVGYYHSHPSGAPLPSLRDAAAAAPDGMIWIIVAGRGTGTYRAVQDGRLHGRFDPVTLLVAD